MAERLDHATPDAGHRAARARWRPSAWLTPSLEGRSDWFPRHTRLGRTLWLARWAAIATWAAFLAYQCIEIGLPFDREGLLAWICGGLLAASVGRHPVWLLRVVVDFLPFAAVLIAYDYLRGMADHVGMPTWWHPQIDVDRFLFFGHEPTVWLQERLKHPYPDVRWYDVLVTICYCSFFFLPYVTAGVLWLRSRTSFYRWSLRFVSLSFVGFLLFMLIPAAPPWAAARCSAAEVASHPSNPACMWRSAPGNASAIDGGILGQMTTHQPGANPWIERTSSWGFHDLHLTVAKSLLDKGQAVADPVAAIPSLHLGGTVLFVLFMWKRVRRWWHPVLVAYPLLMTFSLAYTAEHYVADCIAGALAAVAIMLAARPVERWWRRRRALTAVEVTADASTPRFTPA